MPSDSFRKLREVLLSLRSGTIAVSGGVDSMTLSSFAHSVLGRKHVRMVHALSPAVPTAATARVRKLATREGWQLTEADADEFSDPRYRANPVNRCFFCKSNLYETLNELAEGIVMSGTNRDDLGDYRPGLQAAANNGVRHPYVEAGMTKADVRHLARELGLDDLAELPASPCLSSRVETGISIEPERLSLIDEIETWLQATFSPRTVRCRIRNTGMVIELDPETLNRLSDKDRHTVIDGATARMTGTGHLKVSFAAYVRGSAFVGAGLTPAK